MCWSKKCSKLRAGFMPRPTPAMRVPVWQAAFPVAAACRNLLLQRQNPLVTEAQRGSRSATAILILLRQSRKSLPRRVVRLPRRSVQRLLQALFATTRLGVRQGRLLKQLGLPPNASHSGAVTATAWLWAHPEQRWGTRGRPKMVHGAAVLSRPKLI